MYRGGTKRCPTGKLRHRTEGQAIHVARGPGPLRNRVAVYCALCKGWHLDPAPASSNPAEKENDVTEFPELRDTPSFGSFHQ